VGRGLDKPTATRAKAVFAEWFERTGDHRLAAERAGVSERTGRRWRMRFTRPSAPSAEAERPRTNLRAEATRYVGRTRALAEIRALFSKGSRVVTIVGPGGIGKTRLATRYADVHALDYAPPAGDRDAGGTWFCDLAEAHTADDVCAAVAAALGVPLTRGEDAATQIGHVLAARGRVLLICDNVEQVAAASPDTIGAWAGLAPRAHFLVTSRVQLRLQGESAWELDALEVPAEDEADASIIGGTEAAELFVDRARLVRPGYELDPADAPFVRDLVRRLDGVPLAIELCAARMAVLPPRELCARMEQRFELLASRARGMTRRQTSMRGTIDASWDLLDAVERSALAQCSVFRGGFTVAAAEGVLRTPKKTLDVVQSLVEKSLVFARDDESGARRLGLYESIRDYAAEKLPEEDPDGVTHARHAAHYAQEGAGLAARASGDVEARTRLWLEIDNITAAHAFATKSKTSVTDVFAGFAAKDDPAPSSESSSPVDAALACALAASAALHPRGMLARESAMLDAALGEATRGSLELRARALATRANVRRVRGETELALVDARAASELARDASRDVRAITLAVLGSVHHAAGALDEAEKAYRACLEVADARAPEPTRARAFNGLALLSRLRRRPADALVHAEKALELLRDTGYVRFEAETRMLVATLHQSERRFDDARAAYEAALALLGKGEEPGLAAAITSNLATLEHELGHLEKARTGAERAASVFRALGIRRQEGCAIGNLAGVHAELGRLAEAREGLDRAISILRAAGDRVHEGIFLAQLGAVLARQDDLDRAERALANAEEVLEPNKGDPLYGTLDAQRAFLVLARAKRAAKAGKEEEAAALRDEVASVADRLDESGVTDDVRVAVRVLRQALGAGDLAAPAGAALVVGDEAREVRAPSGATLSLAQRKAPRLVLLRLIEERERAPGKPLSVDDLLAAGWPGERVLADAGASRVYVALGTLRRLGLRNVLLSRDGGYLLDPRIPVRRVTEL
jgi:predicted ATPase